MWWCGSLVVQFILNYLSDGIPDSGSVGEEEERVGGDWIPFEMRCCSFFLSFFLDDNSAAVFYSKK